MSELNLNELAEVVGEFDEAGMEVLGGTLGLLVSGGVYVSDVTLEHQLWCSECDDRETDPDTGEYVETVKDVLLCGLETYAANLLKVIVRVRQGNVAEENE